MTVQNLAGQVLGQYELQELLGIGGMGVVYRAYQKSLERAVVVKVLSAALANEPGYIERFYREAKTAASLEHAHIVPVYDYGVQGDISYVVMRLLTGGTLEQRATARLQAGKPFPSLGEVSTLLGQLASALDYAHRKGVIHRDIKPSNIMFDDQGVGYIVDFGIAKLVEATTSYTASGVPMGTPLYMPPEQWRSEELTPAADQYALAMTIYALLTGGRLPFEATTPYGMMHKHLNEPPAPPTTHRPDLPAALTPVMERALAKRPEDRFLTVMGFAQAFAEAVKDQPGDDTTFFTSPFLNRKILVGTASNPFVTGAGGTASAHPATITIVQPAYKSPIMWALVAALIVALGVIGLVLLRDNQPSEATRRLSATDVQLTLEAGRLSPDDMQRTIQAGVYLAMTESFQSTRTQDAQVAMALTATATRWTLTPSPDASGTAQVFQTQTQAAENATATAARGTDTPTPEPTDTPEPTATRQPTRTAEPTEAPAAAAVTQAATEEPTEESAPPDIRLVYDEDDLVLKNISGQTLDISALVFEQEVDGTLLSYTADLWERPDIGQPPQRMAADTCYQLLIATATRIPPSRDLCPRSWAFQTTVPSRYFWISGEEFVVRSGDTVLATCEVAAGECEFRLGE